MKQWIRKAAKPITFTTANGYTDAREVLSQFVEEFGQSIEPYILAQTPNVLSVGMRCMRQGFTFIWPAGERPYFILPSGQIVVLEVKGDIPYLHPGASSCAPRPHMGERSFACGASAKPPANPVAESAPAGAPGEAEVLEPPDPPPPIHDGIENAEEADMVLEEPVRLTLREEAK